MKKEHGIKEKLKKEKMVSQLINHVKMKSKEHKSKAPKKDTIAFDQSLNHLTIRNAGVYKIWRKESDPNSIITLEEEKHFNSRKDAKREAKILYGKKGKVTFLRRK